MAAPRGLDGFIRQGMTAEEVGKAGASGSSGVQGKRASSGDFGRGGGSYAGEMPATGGQCHASRDPRGRSTVAGQEHERATHDGNIEEDHWQKKGRERHEREYSDDEESANCAKRPRIYRCVEDNSPQPDAVPMGEGEKNIQLHGIVASAIFVSTLTETDFDDNDINQGYQPAAFTNPAGRHSNYQKPSVADETSEGFSRPSLRGGGRISPPDHTHYSDPPMYRHGRGCPIHRYGRYTSPTYYNDRDDPLMPRHNHTDLVRRTISEDFFGRPAERVSHWHSFNNRDAAELLRRLAYNIVLVLVLTALARGLTMEMLVVAMVTMVTQVYPR